MGLAERIGEVFKKKVASARDRYFAAVRTGDAEAAAAAAEVAGIGPDQVASDASILDQAADLRGTVEKLPQLEKATGAARRALDAATKALDTAIAKLEPPVYAAQEALSQADRAERESRSALATLSGLYASHPELLPMAGAPDPLKTRVAGEIADAERGADQGGKFASVRAADLQIRVAKKAIYDAETEVANLAHIYPPPSDDYRAGKFVALEAANKGLAEAEAAFVAACEEAGIPAGERAAWMTLYSPGGAKTEFRRT